MQNHTGTKSIYGCHGKRCSITHILNYYKLLQQLEQMLHSRVLWRIGEKGSSAIYKNNFTQRCTLEFYSWYIVDKCTGIGIKGVKAFNRFKSKGWASIAGKWTVSDRSADRADQSLGSRWSTPKLSDRSKDSVNQSTKSR